MRISILLPLIGAAMVCADISVRADDNAAQAAARAALLQKMNELNVAQSEPINSMPPSASVTTITTNNPAPQNQPTMTLPVKKAPVTPTPVQTQTVQIPVAPPMVGSDYFTTNAATSTPMPSPAVEMSPTAPPTAVENPAPLPPTAKKPGFFGRVLHPFRRTNRSSAVVQVEHPQPIKPDETVKNMGFTPIEPPPPPVSPEQEAELHALLQRYEANQITPEEYQTERAAIIGTR